MKKFCLLCLMVSMGLFAVGCGESSSSSVAPPVQTVPGPVIIPVPESTPAVEPHAHPATEAPAPAPAPEAPKADAPPAPETPPADAPKTEEPKS